MATKKTAKAFDWVPLVAGAKMIVLLGPHGVQVRWSREVCLEANRKLVDALQNGLTEGVGYYEDIGEYSPLRQWSGCRCGQSYRRAD
jgi:hypothetical protein